MRRTLLFFFILALVPGISSRVSAQDDAATLPADSIKRRQAITARDPFADRSNKPNTTLEAYRRGTNFYVVPSRRRRFGSVPAYPNYYRTFRPGYYPGYYFGPQYGGVIIRRTPLGGYRSPTGGSHYFGPPHGSQYFGPPHASQYFATPPGSR